MSIVSSDLARAIVANDASGVIQAVRASAPPCTHVAPGVPAITYAAYLQRPAALDALISECSKNIAVDACYQHAPFAGWRSFHFAKADRDSEAAAKLAAAGADAAPPPNELLGTAWLDLIEGLGNNDFVSYMPRS